MLLRHIAKDMTSLLLSWHKRYDFNAANFHVIVNENGYYKCNGLEWCLLAKLGFWLCNINKLTITLYWKKQLNTFTTTLKTHLSVPIHLNWNGICQFSIFTVEGGLFFAILPVKWMLWIITCRSNTSPEIVHEISQYGLKAAILS